MNQACCSNCKFARLVWLTTGETHGGVHSSDTHVAMHICHHRSAQHYGHLLLGDHSCLGFKAIDAVKRPARKRLVQSEAPTSD